MSIRRSVDESCIALVDIREGSASRKPACLRGLSQDSFLSHRVCLRDSPKKASTPRCLIMIRTSVLEIPRYPRSDRALDTVYCGVVMTMGFYQHIHHMLHSCCLRVSGISLHCLVTPRHNTPLRIGCCGLCSTGWFIVLF